MQAIKATALALCVGSAAAFSAPPSMQLRDAKPAVAPRDADALTGCARTAPAKRVPFRGRLSFAFAWVECASHAWDLLQPDSIITSFFLISASVLGRRQMLGATLVGAGAIFVNPQVASARKVKF